MKKADLHSSPDQVKLTGRLSEFREALQEEINEIEIMDRIPRSLLAGIALRQRGADFGIAFSWSICRFYRLIPHAN